MSDQLQIGDRVRGEIYGEYGRVTAAGVVVTPLDPTDNTVLIFGQHAGDQEVDTHWLMGNTVVKIGDNELPDPIATIIGASARPKYIFMVIRPNRKIATYANLDALLAGMVDADDPKASDRELRIHEAAALAIADPGTDIKIPPGASNSPWLRFAQVEGA